MNSSILNAITIDVEEWYQTILLNRHESHEITNLPNNILDIIYLLDKYHTKATFFIVASLVKKYPGLTKMIVDKGHEISSHGYLHRLVYKMSKQEFIDDVVRSVDILRKSSDTEVIGYRAPTWSITKKTYWAIDVLNSLGLKYDSSIYPVSFNLFNLRNRRRFPYEIEKKFIEFPPSTFQFLGYNFPFAGGFYLRFLPGSFIRNKISEINKKGNPVIIYFHSWEFDKKFSAQISSKWKRLIQCTNLNSVENKIRILLENFKFCPIKEVLHL